MSVTFITVMPSLERCVGLVSSTFLCNNYLVAVQLTGLSSRRSFTRQKEFSQIPSNTVSDVPLSALAPSDPILPAQRLRAGQGPSNTNDIPKPSEITQPVMRPYTTRTDNQNINHVAQHSFAHLTATHSASDRPQVDLPSYLPYSSATVHADVLAKPVSTAEVSSFSKTIPKDVGSGSLRNTLPVTNAQTSSVITGYNVSPFVQGPSNHVQTYGQPAISKPVETAQLVSRYNMTATDSHINAAQTMNLMPMSDRLQPNLIASSVLEPPLAIAHTNAFFKHGSTTEPSSSSKNIPRDDGSTSLRNTHLTSNTQAAVEIGQKVLPPAQNQSNPTQTQACQSGTRLLTVH
jgi:hypothetical protein